ncbi:hypothetical protein PGB90_002254 [Kerria lacca]
MDQGCLELFKRKYCYKLLSFILLDEEGDLIEKLKKVDMLDVVRWVFDSWNEIEPISMIRSWQKFLDHRACDQFWLPNDDFKGERNEKKIEIENSRLLSLLKIIPGCETFEKQDLEEWMSADNNAEYMEDGIVQLVMIGKSDEEINDNEMQIPAHNITHAEAFQIFEKALEYDLFQGFLKASV